MVYDPNETEIITKQDELKQQIKVLKQLLGKLEKELANQELRLKIYHKNRTEGRQVKY